MGLLALPFVVIPLLEIVVFVVVGDRIGVWNLVALIALTGVLGFVVARMQGFAVWRQAQASLRRGEVPGREIAHGVMVLVGAVLLVTPGFVTDAVGFLLMVPPVREGLRLWGKRRLGSRVRTQQGDIFDI